MLKNDSKFNFQYSGYNLLQYRSLKGEKMKLQTYIFIIVAIAGTFLYNWQETQKNKEFLNEYKVEHSRVIAIDSLHSLQEQKIRKTLDSIRAENRALNDSLFNELKKVKRNEWRLKRELTELNKKLEPLPNL